MCGLLAAKYYAINIIQRMLLFFPNCNIILNISDILLAVDLRKGKAYEGDEENTFTNLVWDLLQVYIIKCHTNSSTPTTTAAIFEIRTQINRVLKILPNCQLANICNASPQISQALQHTTI